MENKIRDLVNWLNARTEEYDKGHPTVSDKEFDDKFFELIQLEDETKIILTNSPTQKINYQVINKLNKVQHNHKMLSLDKTKEPKVVESFLGDKCYLAMCKMDGLTCSLRYLNGRLVAAETRGNGIEGEDILHNAMVVSNIPKYINYQDELIVDGEIICPYSVFQFFSNLYSNPRNFAAGSIRLLDSKECAKRGLSFVAWDVIKGFDEFTTLTDKLNRLSFLQFTTVPFATMRDVKKCIEVLKNEAETLSYPIDGIVFKFDDIAYGNSLGETGHHKKNAIAFKFYDELYETKLLDIEWSMGRTGQITPVAIFEPVEIDDTIVERASLHNISVMEELSGGFERIGDTLYIFKANAIIPQVSKWEHNGNYNKELHINIPEVCPVCGGRTTIKMDNDSKVLVCENSDCEGQLINRLNHFCSKNGLDIKGLSKATLSKLMEWGWVRDTLDIMYLRKCRSEWIKKPGFGPASVDKIIKAIYVAQNTTLDKFLSAIGIPLVGKSVASELSTYFNTYYDFRQAVEEQFNFASLPNFGEAKEQAILNFDYSEADEIAKLLNFIVVKQETIVNSTSSCKDLKFAVTGKVDLHKNRDELANKIKALGGSVVSSISKNTSYLINNDLQSTSSKNLSAKKLGIPIITEKEFLEKFCK